MSSFLIATYVGTTEADVGFITGRLGAPDVLPKDRRVQWQVESEDWIF